MTHDRPGVSVVLPCYNRGAYLAHWLAAFACWHPHSVPVEILVVDDGGADHAEAVAERWREHGLDVRYLRLRAPGGPRNNAQARNAGIRASRYPLVLNGDPDVVFVTDVLGRLLEAWEPGTVCSPSGYFPLTRQDTMDLWRESERRVITAADWVRRAAGRQNLVHRPDGVYGLHGAFLCDRATLDRLRGYDERFRCWGWEDRDLLTRLELGLGFRRQYVDGSNVVHQWHPALRADEGSARSQVLWQMGWQRACATSLTTIERNPDGWGELRADDADRQPPPVRVASAGREAWAQVFDAYLYEAQVWRRDGQPRTAMDRLQIALARWWETSGVEAADSRPVAAAIRAAHDAGYARAGDVALEYARAARDAGDRDLAETAAGAAAWPGIAADAAALRARWLADDGRLEAAADLLRSSVSVRPTAEGISRLVEVLLRLRRPEQARALIDAAATRPDAEFDVFEQLLLDGYRVRLSVDAAEGLVWPPRVRGNDAGEFLFSVAMRARRDGLLFGSTIAFDAYLALTQGTEPDLRERARHARAASAAGWEQLLGTSRDERPGTDDPHAGGGQ